MSQLQFDADTARRIEALYLIRDAVHRRELVREALGAARGPNPRRWVRAGLLLPRALRDRRYVRLRCGRGQQPRDASARARPLRWPRQRRAPRRRGHCASGRERDVRRRGLRAGSRVCLGRRSSSRRTAPGPSAGRTRSRLGRGLGDGVDSLARRVLTTRVLRAWDEHLADPSLPRTLSARLRSAGFEDVRVEAHAFAACGRDPERFGAALVPFIATFVAGRQGIGEVEAEAWATEQRELMERDQFYFASTQFCFTATKSAPTNTSAPA